MVMIDTQTAKSGRAGPTFHEAGGRGGHTIGAKRSILIEILGLPNEESRRSVRNRGAPYFVPTPMLSGAVSTAGP